VRFCSNELFPLPFDPPYQIKGSKKYSVVYFLNAQAHTEPDIHYTPMFEIETII